MVRYTFATQKLTNILPSGKVYIYFDEKEGSETVTHKDPETEEETTETYPVWTYQRAESSLPLEKGKLVNDIIRAVYSQGDVEAIMRHKLAGEDDDEFEEFDLFAEEVKILVNKILEQ